MAEMVVSATRTVRADISGSSGSVDVPKDPGLAVGVAIGRWYYDLGPPQGRSVPEPLSSG
jgi:hypothetical protein